MDEGEFFLEIESLNEAQPTLNRSWRVNCIDIEAIEPIQGTKFELRYLKVQSYFTRAKTVKTEVYESKYIAEIMDCFESVIRMIDESQDKLDTFVQENLTP